MGKNKHKSKKSEGGEDYEEMWVEKDLEEEDNCKLNLLGDDDIKHPDLFDSLISKYATLDNKNDRAKLKLAKEQELEEIRQSRELNPNFKLQQSSQSDSNATSNQIYAGDGGASWLRKSFKRAKEQALERGCPIDQIISERWGSLENFKKLLEDAEKKEDLLLQSRDQDNSTRGPPNHFHKPRFQNNINRYNHSHSSPRPHFAKPDIGRENDNYGRSHTYPSAPHNSDGQKWKKNQGDKSEMVSSSDIPKSMDAPPRIKVNNPEPFPRQRFPDLDADPHGFYSQLVAAPDLPLSLYQLNKVGAEHLRSMISCETGGGGGIWAELLDRARRKYLETAPVKGANRRYDNNNGGGHRGRGRGGGANRGGGRDDWRGRTGDGRDGKYGGANNYQAARRDSGKVEFDSTTAPISVLAAYERMAPSHGGVESAYVSLATKFSSTRDDDLDEPAPSTNSREAKRIKGEIDSSIQRGREHTIRNYKNALSSIENCNLCFDSPQMVKHTLISYGQKCYLAIPGFQPLVPYECYLCPMNHVTTDHDVDGETAEELKKYQDGLCQMFATLGMDVVFLYGCFNTKKFFHLKITCIPVPTRVASQLPMYFKKAIMESEYEWSDNKKIIEMTAAQGPAKVVPKGFPYFAFHVGSASRGGKGYAHVIENREGFPPSFGKEVIGGVIDAEPNLYRKPRNRTFEQLSQAIIDFMELWKPFDFTAKSQEPKETVLD